MPAVSIDNILTLPRLAEPVSGGPSRPVVSITTAPKGFEGEGFPVRRAFAGVAQDVLDPFIHMDQMGEVEYAPGEPKGTPWHPHRGFETVTYMIDGTFNHQDSNGGGGTIANGATQWMTAGAGILHIEKPPEQLVASGGLFHGVQLWVNLPSTEKMSPPQYQSLESNEVVLLASADGASLLRVIAGEVDGHKGPGSTHTPINFVHATIYPGSRVTLPWPGEFNALVYVLSGKGSVGSTSAQVVSGQLAAFGNGSYLDIFGGDPEDSRSEALEVLVLGGRPLGEPVAWYGPFVMNTRDELARAFEDYNAGRLGVIPAQSI